MSECELINNDQKIPERSFNDNFEKIFSLCREKYVEKFREKGESWKNMSVEELDVLLNREYEEFCREEFYYPQDHAKAQREIVDMIILLMMMHQRLE